MLTRLLVTALGIVSAVPASPAPPAPKPAPVRIVTLGDSITRGVRPGVRPEETFSALLGERLRGRGFSVEVVNLGVGGERTEQALARLEPAALSLHPAIVIVMYGTNDSYVDRGARESRLSVGEYGANLKKIVAAARKAGAQPVLMTAPRWADDASPNGLGENPNVRLEPYVRACRETARRTGTPLADHYRRWTRARRKGVNLREWTTDGCHPNPRGHRELVEVMLPVILRTLRRARRPAAPARMSATRLEGGATALFPSKQGPGPCRPGRS